MRKNQRARRWIMRELDRLSEKRHCDQPRKPCLATSKSATTKGH